MTDRIKLWGFALLSLAAVIGIFVFMLPIAQVQSYYDFADTRDFLGIPNFGDVVGNIFFVYFGMSGLQALKKEKLASPPERLGWMIFFAGSVLVAFGSAWFHLEPNNHTLVWDRLPMTIAFMSFFAVMIMERIGIEAGRKYLPALLILGAASVLYWAWTENAGRGDLRPYALVQFLPMLLIPLMLMLFKPRYTGIRYLLMALGCYIAAKLLEHFDVEVFDLTWGIISGHTLKHMAAALAVYAFVLYVEKRKLAEPAEKPETEI